jgi:nucleotide-binding universal stress UspA family protein
MINQVLVGFPETAATAEAGFEPEVIRKEGGPRAEILRYAEVIGADMVALASGLKTSPMERTFGTTALTMVRQAGRPCS